MKIDFYWRNLFCNSSNYLLKRDDELLATWQNRMNKVYNRPIMGSYYNSEPQYTKLNPLIKVFKLKKRE